MSINSNAAIESSIVNSITDTNQQTEQLKKHREVVNKIKAKDSPESNNIHANPDKVTRQQNIAATQQTDTIQLYKPIWRVAVPGHPICKIGFADWGLHELF